MKTKFVGQSRPIKILNLLIAFVIFCCGCASEHFIRGHGDAGQFILQQAIAYGGQPISTNSLPLVGVKWRYFEDQYGVVIRGPLELYPAVDNFLRQSFGTPRFGPSTIADEGKYGAYRLTPKGGGIQFVADKKWTQVTVLRPLSKPEFADFVQRTFTNEQVWKELQKRQ